MPSRQNWENVCAPHQKKQEQTNVDFTVLVLLNVFPKSIAEQLLTKGEGSYQPQLIAEEYKEATILFAGIPHLFFSFQTPVFLFLSLYYLILNT